MRKSSVLKVAVLTLGVLVVADAIAEAQGRRRGQRGRTGFSGGSRTFGMLATNEYLQKEMKMTKAQVDRMGQIDLQMQGTRALTSEKVVKALGISKTQEEALQKAQRSAFEGLFGNRGRRGGGNNGGQRNFEDIRKRFEEARKKSETEMMKVLTTSQRSAYKKLLGAPIDRSKLQTPRRGGGPGGNRGPQRKKRPDV